LNYIKIHKKYHSIIDIIGEYKTLTHKNPYDNYSHFGLGLAFFFNKNSQEAIKEFSRALKHGPDEPVIYYYRAKAYMLQRAKELALRDMRKVLDLEPTNLEYIYILMEFLIDTDHLKLAKELLFVLQKQVPGSPLALCGEARLDLEENDLREAKTKLKKTARQGRKYHLLQLLSGKIARKEGNNIQALKHYRNALLCKPFWEEAEKEIEELLEAGIRGSI